MLVPSCFGSIFESLKTNVSRKDAKSQSIDAILIFLCVK